MKQPQRLIVMAGGTGGHIFSGLAVALHLMEQGWQVRWLGTADHMEANLIPKYGIEIDFIHIEGLRGKGLSAFMLSPFLIFKALRQAHAVIKDFKPNAVLGMGGYVSGPGGLAAWLLGIPVILHEQNAIAGLTNKLLAKIATKVMQAFPGAFPKAKVVGNPVRVDVLALPTPKERLIDRKGPVRVLIVGGSQGASILNQTMPKVARKLANSISIWHQSGQGEQQAVKQAYAKVGQPLHKLKVNEFIEDIATAYSWADVVVCRAGALTVSEIAAAGLPAVFVPFQHKDRQQYWNAVLLEKVGAAKIIEQPQFTADAVATTLAAWNQQTLLKMAECARASAILDATEKIANEVSLAAKS